MLKSTLNDDLTEVIAYPCLMVSNKGNVVLFTFPRKGTIVHVADSVTEMGGYSTSWCMDFFKPYRGEVTLKG